MCGLLIKRCNSQDNIWEEELDLLYRRVCHWQLYIDKSLVLMPIMLLPGLHLHDIIRHCFKFCNTNLKYKISDTSRETECGSCSTPLYWRLNSSLDLVSKVVPIGGSIKWTVSRPKILEYFLSTEWSCGRRCCVVFPKVAKWGLKPLFFQDGIPIDVLVSLEVSLKLIIFARMLFLHFECLLQHF